MDKLTSRGKKPLTRQDKLDRASDAQRLMESPLMIDFFNRAEEQLFERWRSSAYLPLEEREKLNLQQIGLEAFKEFLHKTIVDGQMAKRDIDGQ